MASPSQLRFAGYFEQLLRDYASHQRTFDYKSRKHARAQRATPPRLLFAPTRPPDRSGANIILSQISLVDFPSAPSIAVTPCPSAHAAALAELDGAGRGGGPPHPSSGAGLHQGVQPRR